MKCPECGANNPKNNKFCGDCGEALSQPEVQSTYDGLMNSRKSPTWAMK